MTGSSLHWSPGWRAQLIGRRYFFSRGNSLVVLGRQVDSVLVPGGGQVLLQTLDLLGVFLMADRLTHVHHLFPVLVRNISSSCCRPTLMSVLLVSFWFTSGLFRMCLALLAYSRVLRVSCVGGGQTGKEHGDGGGGGGSGSERVRRDGLYLQVRRGGGHSGNDGGLCSPPQGVLQDPGQLRLSV